MDIFDKPWTNPGGDWEIKVRGCKSCGWVIRHPIRWCSNCGGELVVIRMREREYYERSHQFHLDTGWDWTKAKFDHESGKPIDWSRQGKEKE